MMYTDHFIKIVFPFYYCRGSPVNAVITKVQKNCTGAGSEDLIKRLHPINHQRRAFSLPTLKYIHKLNLQELKLTLYLQYVIMQGIIYQGWLAHCGRQYTAL